MQEDQIESPKPLKDCDNLKSDPVSLSNSFSEKCKRIFCSSKKRKIVTGVSAFIALGVITAGIAVAIVFSQGKAVVTSQREITGFNGETYVHYNLDLKVPWDSTNYKVQAIKTTSPKLGSRMLGTDSEPEEITCIYMDVPDTGATVKQCNGFAPEVILDGDSLAK